MKLIFSAALAASLCALPAARAATPTVSDASTNAKPKDAMAELFGDPVIAKGKGFEIKRSELDEVMAGIKTTAAMRNQPIPAEQLALIQKQMLDRLIQIQILLQRATPADKAEGKEKMDTQIAALIQRSGSKEAFERQLKTVGITADDLRAKVIQEATAMAALKRELKVTVTDADVKKFYEENPAEFEQPETAHVRHILLLTMDPTTRQPLALDQQQAKRKKIDDILKQIRSGGDFAALATQYSEDPGSKDNGGELPDFPRGQMLPEFEAAAFSLATNQVSDMVTTMYGYHIIKLLGKTPAKKVALTDKAPLTEQTIADKVKEALSQQQVEKLAPAYLDGLKKSSGVEILDPALKALESSSTNAPLVAPVR